MNYGDEKFEKEKNAEKNYDILINILLARERSFNDPNINGFASYLISMPSRAFEEIAGSLLPDDDYRLSEFREWHAKQRFESVNSALYYLSSKLAKCENILRRGQCNDEQRALWQTKLEERKKLEQELLQEINELRPVINVLKIRDKIKEEQKELEEIMQGTSPLSALQQTNKKVWLPGSIQQNIDSLNTGANKEINKKFITKESENFGYSPKKCQAQTRNRSSGRCRKTPCRSGKIRDVTSGRCRSKKASGRKRKSPKRKSPKRKSPKRKSPKRK